MNAHYELVSDEQGRFRFVLLDSDGQVLLNGLPSSGKIAAQQDLLHARNSIGAGSRLVPHESQDGRHFVVLKDRDGSVLGRSRQVATAEDLQQLIALLGQLGTNAPLVDRTRTQRVAH